MSEILTAFTRDRSRLNLWYETGTDKGWYRDRLNPHNSARTERGGGGQLPMETRYACTPRIIGKSTKFYPSYR